MKNHITYIFSVIFCFSLASQNSKKINFNEVIRKISEKITIDDEYYLVKFHNKFELINCEFKTEAIFSNSTFSKKTIFRRSKFDSTASFIETVFKSSVDFSATEYNGKALFNLTEFKKPANFNRTTFNGKEEVDFVSTKFDSIVTFEYARFNSPVSFENAKFNKKLNLSKASFYKDVSFYHTQLPDTLILEGVKTKETIDLTHINLKKGVDYCYINLFDAAINKIKLRYDKFRLIMPKKIETDSLYEKTTYVYESLLKNFQDSGFLNSYETLDKEYQEFKFTKDPDRTKVGKITGKFLNWLNWAWNDYGYSKVRIWPITLVSFLFFFLINLIFFNYFIKKVYNIPELRKSYIDNDEKSRVIINFFYTSFIFFGFKLNTENFNFKHPIASMYVFFQYMVGLVCLAYLANFVISSTLIGL